MVGEALGKVLGGEGEGVPRQKSSAETGATLVRAGEELVEAIGVCGGEVRKGVK